MSRTQIWVCCRVCRRYFASYVPKGGDGSMRMPYKHTRQRTNRMTGEWQIEDCPGRFEQPRDEDQWKEVTRRR